jgi:hypothetical protein
MSDPKSKTKVTTRVPCERDSRGCHVERISSLIEKRAYEIYEARGKEPGHEEEDWFQAEREIKHHLGLQ